MRKIIAAFVVLSSLLCVSGCSSNNVSSNYAGNSGGAETGMTIDLSSTVNTKDVLIEALEKKDKELFKSIFSKQTLTFSDNIDKGTDHIFSIYKGDYIETVYKNQSGTSMSDIGASLTDSVCVIKTTEECYIFHWLTWNSDSDPDFSGVYSLSFEPCSEDCRNTDKRTVLAGIGYPGNEFDNNTAVLMQTGLYRNDVSCFREIFTDDLYNGSEKNGSLSKILEKYSPQGNFILNAWRNDDMLFMKLRVFNVYICMKLDEQNGKVTSVRILDSKKYTDQSVQQYDFSSDINDIYLIEK